MFTNLNDEATDENKPNERIESVIEVDFDDKIWKRMPITHAREIIIPAFLILLEGIVICYVLFFMDSEHDKGFSLIAAHYAECCSFVVTFATITTAVVVLFYSLINSKNFGVPRRTIMYYFVGSIALPLMFISTIIELVILKGFEYREMCVQGSVLAVFSFLKQILVIVLTTLSSSYRFSINRIVAEERWQYKKQRKLDRDEKRYFTAWKTPHISCAMRSDDLFHDKCRLLKKVLWIPVRSLEKNYRHKKDITECKEDGKYLFDFYYDHTVGAMEAVKDK